MGAKTDQTAGRVKQAVGAVTGDDEIKREGQRQEDKGKLRKLTRRSTRRSTRSRT